MAWEHGDLGVRLLDVPKNHSKVIHTFEYFECYYIHHVCAGSEN